MQYVYIMCSKRNAQALSWTLKAQITGSTIVATGATDKLEIGYVVLSLVDVPDCFPGVLDVNGDVLDFAVYEDKKPVCSK